MELLARSSSRNWFTFSINLPLPFFRSLICFAFLLPRSTTIVSRLLLLVLPGSTVVAITRSFPSLLRNPDPEAFHLNGERVRRAAELVPVGRNSAVRHSGSAS